ncbi:trypsin-like peptidase domain-containing protein [Tritonibacter mobilis]|uniref:trypsin-like peptidase domain-containing protein n=1 Tax=Tritonibacter mobilis TaxID=379347 RepID=UPI001CD93704|nr:trypsin-like peptidase domain-containing protein [Tritonibacter mobilis]MCA2007792.1 trypsin-like peptidase domain-containing protein [Tritonibacter mobilis]
MIRSLALPLTLALVTSLPLAAQAETKVPQSQTEISLGFAPLVKEAAPAVVNIYAKIIRQDRARSPFADDPFFDDFFRQFAQPRPRVQNSLGSGVILSEDGIVVSNYHVVGEASDIRVVTNDRREYQAEVILADQASDLAILQLKDAEGLPFLGLRNSDEVEVGELTLAIGNPFGVGQTVSSGIISGLARTGTGGGQGFGYYIQTDAPINPGNSGGALIDVNGDLIGINTRILSRSGGSNGIGFAIPANLVREFVRQAREGEGEFQRPWAGMTGQPVDSDLAEALGLGQVDGMLISELHPQSPFVEAGFEVGDVVLAVDGEPVNSPSEMAFRLSVAELGGTSAVTRVRQGETETVEVALMEAPNSPAADPITLNEQTPMPGLVVGQVNPQVITKLQLPLSTEGVVVMDPGPYAGRGGVRAGDLLLAINGEEITAPEDVANLLMNSGRWMRLDLLRQGQRVSLRFRL